MKQNQSIYQQFSLTAKPLRKMLTSYLKQRLKMNVYQHLKLGFKNPLLNKSPHSLESHERIIPAFFHALGPIQSKGIPSSEYNQNTDWKSSLNTLNARGSYW